MCVCICLSPSSVCVTLSFYTHVVSRELRGTLVLGNSRWTFITQTREKQSGKITTALFLSNSNIIVFFHRSIYVCSIMELVWFKPWIVLFCMTKTYMYFLRNKNSALSRACVPNTQTVEMLLDFYLEVYHIQPDPCRSFLCDKYPSSLNIQSHTSVSCLTLV